jgi:hypothetical protein
MAQTTKSGARVADDVEPRSVGGSWRVANTLHIAKFIREKKKIIVDTNYT